MHSAAQGRRSHSPNSFSCLEFFSRQGRSLLTLCRYCQIRIVDNVNLSHYQFLNISFYAEPCLSVKVRLDEFQKTFSCCSWTTCSNSNWYFYRYKSNFSICY